MRWDIDADGVKYQIVTIGMYPSAPLSYALGSGYHCPTISMIGGHGGRLYRERY